MPAIKKVTTKKAVAKKAKPAVKKTVKKVAKKAVTTRKTPAAPKKEPAKKKIAVRKVTTGEVEIEKTEKEPIQEEHKVIDEKAELEEFLRDFSEDHARQEEDQHIEHPGMLPVSRAVGAIAVQAEENDQDSLDPFRVELEEKTQHEEIGYEEKQEEKQGEEDAESGDVLAYNDSLGRSVSLYRKIAYFFIALVALLLMFIFFFSIVKTTIVLIPDQERIQNNIIFDVYDKDNGGAGEKAIKGLVRKLDIEETKTYPATGKRVIGQEAVGEVTIHNNYSKNQPLVATTRLLSANNKLFRIKKTVNVPAGGSVDVEIYADDPSPEMEIGPSRFTIPGLWAGLQDKIYAESKNNVVYQKKTNNRITKEDIDNSIRDLKQILLAEAKLEVSENYKEYTEIIYNIDESSIISTVDGKIDEEKDEFEVSVEAIIIAVAFDNAQATTLARQKFDTSLSDNKELLSFNEEITYTLSNFDFQQGVATINATFEGKVSLKENSEIIDKNKIVGLKESQLKVYLDSLPGIAGYEINFYPSFIKKVPKLVDRINVEIRK